MKFLGDCLAIFALCWMWWRIGRSDGRKDGYAEGYKDGRSDEVGWWVAADSEIQQAGKKMWQKR